jgi:hypothetical protein
MANRVRSGSSGKSSRARVSSCTHCVRKRPYYSFLRNNIAELVEEHPDDLAGLHARPPILGERLGPDSLVLATKHSTDFEPYVQRGSTGSRWDAFTRPDRATENTTVMYGYLGRYLDNARLRAVRVAAHAHLVHLLQSPEKVAQAWKFRAILSAPYAAADEVVTAIRRSGLRRDQLGSDVLRYALDGLWELARDPTGQSEKFTTC